MSTEPEFWVCQQPINKPGKIRVFNVPRPMSGAEKMNEQDCKFLIRTMHRGNTKDLSNFLQLHPHALHTRLCAQGKYAIHYAARAGHAPMVKYICEQEQESIFLKDNYGQTALILAASRGKKDVVDALITRGSDINAQSIVPTNPSRNRSVLNWARAGNHHSCVRLILDAKLSKAKKEYSLASNDNAKIAEITYRVYKEFIEDKNQNAIDYLLRLRTNYFQSLNNSQLLELLTLTNEECSTETVKLFLQKQRWPVQVSPEGYNLVQWAVVNGHTRLVIIRLCSYRTPNCSRTNM